MKRFFSIQSLFFTVMLMASSFSMKADSFIVTTNADMGAGSLREAVMLAAASPATTDDITFQAGIGTITLATEIMIMLPAGETLDIIGNGDPTTIDGGGAVRIFNFTMGGTLNIDMITFQNAMVTGNGAAISNMAGILNVSNSTFTNNVAMGAGASGGAIFSDGTLTVDATTFDGNTAERAGGAIEIGTNSTATTLTDVDMTNNDALGGGGPGNGGGLHITGASDITYTGGTVSMNTAALEGGGLWNGMGTMTLSDLTIDMNDAQGAAAADDGGGGVFNNLGTVIADATVAITNNTASGVTLGSGGGILNLDGTITLTGTTITGNSAQRAGGGIEATAASTNTLTDVTLDMNDAGPTPGNGGGMHITGAGNADISGGTVNNNTATQEGGGLWNGTGTMTIDGVTITGNVASGPGADQGGGGVFNQGGTVDITDGLINLNIADGASGSGGGIFNEVGGELTVTGTMINNNRANRAGGAIEDNSGAATTVVLTDVTMTGNLAGVAPAVPAPGNGGGVHISGDGNMDIIGGVVNQNAADREGGGLWNGTGTMNVDGVMIDQNDARGGADATDGGGGIFNNGGILNVINGTTITDNTASSTSTNSPGTAGSGGGILNLGGALTVMNSTITGNSAQRAGGGIEASAGTTNDLTNVTLDMNDAGPTPGNGGGLHITGAGDATITDGTVNMNTASQEGGGLWNGAGTMDITGTTIDGNTASGDDPDQGGGGIFNLAGTVNINMAMITNNTADGAAGSGGGILTNDNTTLNIDATTISGNSSMRAGGGIEARPGSFSTLTDVILNMNSTGAAPGNGGGMHITGDGDAFITGGTVNMNTAAAEGGGLWNGTGGMTITDVTIDGNTASGAPADQGGGGIFNQGGTIGISGSTITNNVADGAAGSGGGILNDMMGTVTILLTDISGNTSVRAGGGIEATAGTTTELILVTLNGNSTGASPGNGGGMHVTGAGTATIDQTTVDGNSAANEGGGLWASAAGAMTVTNSTVSNNDAPDGGGLFLQGGGAGTLDITNVTVSGNTATNGGGVQVEGGTFTAESSTIASNTASSMGGGVNVVAGDVNINNNIIGDNEAPTGPDYNGAFATATFNVVESDMGHTIMNGVDGNIVGFDPQLMPLADNGGVTQTHLPTGASPALDRGDSNEGTDQRGETRGAGGVDDMGAVEVQVGELSNDMCEGAFEPFECGDILFGTTGTATAAGSPPPCDPNTGANQPGVFFTFEGNGFRTTVSTDFPGTNFDTEINVYSGSCGNLTCVGGDDDSGANNTSTFSFDTQVGVDYFVYVSGEGGAQGQFQIGFDARLLIVCRPPVSGNVDEGVCSATFELLPPVVLEGECMLGTLTSDAPASFPLGTTTVIWTATSADPDGIDPVMCEQTVTINDIEAPVLDCPASVNLYTSWNNCGYPASILGTPSATDNCSAVTVTADPDNQNFYGPGQYMRNFTATDAFGNQSTCMQWVRVFDTTDPKINNCPDDIVVSIESGTGTNVNFTTPSGMDNCPGQVMLADNNFSSGDFFEIGDTDVTFTFLDQAGNDAHCNFTVTVQLDDDANVATTVAGMLATEAVETVMDVEVYINGTDGMNSMNVTLEDGMYNFEVPMGGDYTISPVKDIDLLNGITTYDLILINKHILGIEPLTSPYQLLAADVNRSNAISTLDLVHLQKAILFISDEFPNNTSWRFVDSAFEFADATNPFGQDIPEIININNIDQAQNNADFVAIKVGDINGNAATNLVSADDRTAGETLTMNTANTQMKAGETYEIALTAADFDHTGFQFTLNFDNNKVAFDNIDSDLAEANNFGLTLLEKGAITVSWFDQVNQKLAADAPVLTLTVTAKANTTLAEVLSINSRFTTAEAYAANGDLENIELTFDNATAGTFKMYQNVPNPFTEATTIGFDLPTATTADITVSDVSGRVVYQSQVDGAKGFNQVEITRADLPSSGVWYFTIKTDNDFATGKMILID